MHLFASFSGNLKSKISLFQLTMFRANTDVHHFLDKKYGQKKQIQQQGGLVLERIQKFRMSWLSEKITLYLLPTSASQYFKYLYQTSIQRTSPSDPFCSLYRIIHYIKFNMLSKSSKRELGFAHYIMKFTISRFIISRIECTYILHKYYALSLEAWHY